MIYHLDFAVFETIFILCAQLLPLYSVLVVETYEDSNKYVMDIQKCYCTSSENVIR